MANCVISFSKAKDAIKLQAESNNVVCKTNRASLNGALSFLKDAFGYSSVPEDLHARSNRFGQDIFEGADIIRVCALLKGDGDLVLELVDNELKPDVLKMGANEFWIMGDNDSISSGCEAHFFSCKDEGSRVIRREEMKTIYPDVHNTIIWNAKRLQDISASRQALFKDIAATGAQILKGPQS